MSKHWRPDEHRAVPLPDGAKAGLVLLGLACVALAAGMYQAFGPLEPVAPEAAMRPSRD